MTIKNPSFRAQLIVAAGMILLLWLSNQHFSFANPYTHAVAGDTKGYFWIATNAPELNSKKIPQHRAQRFVVPVAIGVVARGLGIREETGFYLAVLFVSFAIVYRWQRLIQWCGYSGTTAIAITAMLIFNPYAFRFCFAFPGMVGDLIFIWSLLHVLDSLLKGQAIFLIFWMILMALARQTALICLPAIVFGILFLPSWNKPQGTRILYALSVATVTGLVYQFSRSIAAPFSIPTSSWNNLSDGMAWYLFQFDWVTFRTFFLRFVLAFWIPVTLLLGCLALGLKASHDRSSRVSQILLWILTVSICAQPILFGPELTGGNIQRLTVLSLAAALLILAPRLEMTPFSQDGSALRTGSLLLVLWLSSLHHLYSFWGPQIDAAVYFAGFHLVSSFATALIIFLPYDRTCSLGS